MAVIPGEGPGVPLSVLVRAHEEWTGEASSVAFRTMKLADAQTLLLEKMVEHGLVDLGWKMNWDDAKKRFGYCYVSKKVISLSRPLTEANPESEVRRGFPQPIRVAWGGLSAVRL